MPHQRLILDVGLEIDRETGVFAYREVIFSLPRQCGKTVTVFGLAVDRGIMWPERQRIVYSAQTGSEGRKKLLDDFWPVLEKSSLAKCVRKLHRAQGHEQITFKNGSILEVAASTEEAAHGFTIDLGIVDEAWHDEDNRREQALVPGMSTRPWAQLWVCSTQGTDRSAYLNRKTEQGRAAAEEDSGSGIAYFEWSIPEDADIENPEVWWQYHPALGWTISEQVLRHDLKAMHENEWRRAHGNQRCHLVKAKLIPSALWELVQSETAEVERGRALVFGVDVHHERASAAIVATDGKVIELVDYGEGTSWVIERCKELKEKYGGRFVVDSGGPAAYIGEELEKLGLVVVKISNTDFAAACARIYDAIADAKVVFRKHAVFDVAVEGLAKKPVGDRFVWSRQGSTSDITAFVAATLALAVAPEATKVPFAIWT